MQMMAQVEKRKEHNSLWDEDGKVSKLEDPMGYADRQEISCADGPDLNASPESIVTESC